MAEIVELLASRAHRFVGRPEDGPEPEQPDELVHEITLRAGLGIVGDRYFGHPAHREASVTVIAAESLTPGAGLRQVRRNILLRGVAVDSLVGSTLVLDSGSGPVRLRVARPANPCAWMNVTVGPGAMSALRGKGGVRCVPLDDGVLSVGPVVAEIIQVEH